MSQLSDFEFDEAEISEPTGAEAVTAVSAAVPAAPPQAAPVIVVERRASRGLATMLAPPALILLAALVITSYQRTQPVRFIIPPQIAALPSTPTTTAPPDEKIVVHAEKDGRPVAPAEPVAVKPEKPAAPDADRSPFEFDPPEEVQPKAPAIVRVVPFDPTKEAPPAKAEEPKPPAAKAVAANVAAENAKPAAEVAVADFARPIPAPAEPAKEDILNDIEREAREKAVAKDDLEGQKENARGQIFEEALDRVRSDRAQFRDDLKKAIEGLGNDAAPEIERLCQQYGRDALPQVLVAYKRLQYRAPARMSEQVEVDLMRMAGLPEPLVLDKLVEKLVTRYGKTREGPRDKNAATVIAARKLLTLPVKKGVRLATPTRFRNAPGPRQ